MADTTATPPAPATTAAAPKTVTMPHNADRMKPPPGDPNPKGSKLDRVKSFMDGGAKPEPTAAQRQQQDGDGRVPAAREAKPATAPSKEVPKDLTQATKDKTVAAKPAEAAKPVEAKPAAKETAKPADGHPSYEDATKMRSGELSRHYKKVKEENEALRTERDRWKSDAEKNPAGERLQKELDAVKSKLDHAESELRYSRFESSEEYQSKYWQPYEKAFLEGREFVSELRVRELKDDVTGEITQERRTATPQDFDAIAAMDNTADAAELAEKLFGQVLGAEVMQARREVIRLNKAKEEAREKYRKEGGEIFKQRQEAQAQQQQAATKRYQDEIARAAKEFPSYFAPDENDAKGSEELAKGMAWADAAFTGSIKNEDGSDRKLNSMELATLHAAIRNKAGAFDRLAYQKRQLEIQLKEAQEKLKRYEQSEPGAGGGDGGHKDPEAPASGRDSVRSRMERFLT